LILHNLLITNVPLKKFYMLHKLLITFSVYLIIMKIDILKFLISFINDIPAHNDHQNLADLFSLMKCVNYQSQIHDKF